MKKHGMTTKAAYWYRSQTHERPELIVPAINGNRLLTARIVRPKSEPRYRVTGWDMQMNNVKAICESMESAICLALGMLHARIKPLTA